MVAAGLTVVSLVAGCAVDVGVTARSAEPSGAGPLAAEPDDRDDRDEADATPAPSGSASTDPPPDQPSPSDPSTEPSTDEPSPVVTPQGGRLDLSEFADVGSAKPPRSYDTFVAAALADLESWLAVVHPEIYGQPFRPLAGGVYPAYPGRDDIPGCGTAQTQYRDVADYGAFYCPLDDFIVYDDGDDSVLTQLADDYGPAVVGVVLAHEFAHAVQSRTGDLDRGLATVILEQHADCVAGAWFARAVSGASEFVRLGDDDLTGALITMVAVRDPVGIDTFAPGSHGSAFDRIGAFQEGFRNGPARCAGLIDSPLPLMPNQFQSFTDLANDGDLPFGYERGQIVPLVVDALNAYWRFELGRVGVDLPPLQLTPVGAVATATSLPCSDVSAEPPVVVLAGLVLCPADRRVVLDDAVARDLYDDPIDGRADFAVGYFVAQAWSEHVQRALASSLTGTERALANDCLVGSWTRDLDPRRPSRPDEGDTRGTISPGDLDEAVLAAIEVADREVASGNDVGSAFDKIDAYRSGVLEGFEACVERIGR